MAGTEAVGEPVRRRWQLPPAVQESLSAIIVALLVPGVIGLFGMWNSVSNLTGELRHLKDQQSLIHAQQDIRFAGLDRRVSILEAWKDEFGRKERFGLTDGEKLERRFEKLENKYDVMQFANIDHDKRSNTYIEKIDHLEKMEQVQNDRLRLIGESINEHLRREEHRGTP
jgi:hypothetical protein